MEIAQQGDQIAKYRVDSTRDPFGSIDPPVVHLYSYVERITRLSLCSPECYIICLLYIDRLLQSQSLNVCSNNIHKLLITSIMIAAKFFDDSIFDNAHFAQVGGISLKEINALEIEFLKLINYRLHVEPEDFAQYRDSIIAARSLFIENLESFVTNIETSEKQLEDSEYSTTDNERIEDSSEGTESFEEEEEIEQVVVFESQKQNTRKFKSDYNTHHFLLSC
jgi:hypothetical protein